MRVSRNELIELLKLVFESLGFDQGDYESASQLVVCAEMWGLDGLEALAEALSGQGLQQHKAVRLIEEGQGVAVIDGRGLSSLLCLRSAADLAYVKSLSVPVGQVAIVGCQQRILVLQHLVNLGHRGIACGASWWDGVDYNSLHLLDVVPVNSDARPSYRVYRFELGEVDAARAEQLFVYCSSSQQAVSDYQAQLLPALGKPIKKIEAAEMQANFEASLVAGILVEDALWSDLVELAAKMLVPTSIQSRLGAGD